MKKLIVVAALIAISAVCGIVWFLRPRQELQVACIADKRCGFINDEGQYVVAPEFDHAIAWIKDAGLVWRGDRVGSVDHNGRFITEPRSRRLSFILGAYSVEVDKKQVLTDHALRPLNSELWDYLTGIRLDRRSSAEAEYIIVGRGPLYGLADAKGRVILEPKYEEIAYWPAFEFPLRFKEHNLFGHLAASGESISAQRWDEAGIFFNKRASVGRAGKCGYIDSAGIEVIPLSFDECRPFIHSDATFVLKGDVFSLIDRNGVVVKDGLAEAGEPSEEGMPIAVRVQDKWGAIDMKGNFSIPAEFDGVEALRVAPEGVSVIALKTVAFIVKIQGRHGIMDGAGKWVLPARFDEIDTPVDGDGKLATFRDGALWGVVDLETRKATAALWDKVKATRRAVLLPVRKGDKWGYADAKGNMRISARFDEAEIFHGDWASVQIGEKWGLIDSNGAQVTPIVFDSVYNSTPERVKATLFGSRGVVTRKGRFLGFSEADLQKAGLRN